MCPCGAELCPPDNCADANNKYANSAWFSGFRVPTDVEASFKDITGVATLQIGGRGRRRLKLSPAPSPHTAATASAHGRRTQGDTLNPIVTGGAASEADIESFKARPAVTARPRAPRL